MYPSKISMENIFENIPFEARRVPYALLTPVLAPPCALPVVLPGGNCSESVWHGVSAIGCGVHRAIHAGGESAAVLTHMGLVQGIWEIEWDGMEGKGREWKGREWDRLGYDEIEWNGKVGSKMEGNDME